jgi:hypothetical protein
MLLVVGHDDDTAEVALCGIGTPFALSPKSNRLPP